MTTQDLTSTDKTVNPNGANQPDVEAQDGTVGDKTTTTTTPGTSPEGVKPVSSPKTYSESELTQRIDSIKAGHQGTVKKMREDFAQATRRLEELEAQLEEAQFTQVLKPLDAEGTPPDMASYVKGVVERDKSVRKLLRETEKQRAALAQRETELNQAAIGYKSIQLAKEHGLDDAIADELVKVAVQAAEAGTDAILAMENKALRLKLEGKKVAERPVEKPDKANVVKPDGVDLDKLTPEQRLGLVLAGKLK